MPERNVFLAVSGATPVVLTEAIWALAVKDGIRLDEVQVVTTPTGKDLLDKAGLFDEVNGPLALMRKDWKSSAKNIPSFGKHNAHVPKGMRKKDLSDSDENACMEAEITAHLRRFTGDTSTKLFASLAGGRKTMSAYMILGMTAFARPEDRLFHVLSEAPGGFSPNDWYYPSPKKPIERKWVNLFDVPFPKLRKTFETYHPELLRTSLTHAFEEFNKNAEEPTVTVNLGDKRRFFEVDGQALKLEPKALLWLALLAHRKLTCGVAVKVRCRDCKKETCRLSTVGAGNQKGDGTKFVLSPGDYEFCREAYGTLRGDADVVLSDEEIQNPRWWAACLARMRKELPAQLGMKTRWFDGALERGAGGRSAGGMLGIGRKGIQPF
jgi:CRISPR-associated protein (TIGR02584 family)